MKLISDWKSIALFSHSMWGYHFTGLFLLLPELLYGVLGVDTNPLIWWSLAVAAWIWGSLGRVVDQGSAAGRIRGPWKSIAAILLLALALFAWKGDWRDLFPAPAAEATHEASLPVQEAASVLPVADHVLARSTDRDAAFTALAVAHIGKWEGLRLTAYRDIVGVWTVCFGETKGVQPGDTYTRAECEAMLAREVIAYRDRLHGYFSVGTISQRLPVTRDVAYVSLAYNVGVSGAGRSTAVRRLNAGDIAGGCTAIGWWNRAGGRVIRGLVNRRADDMALCRNGLA